VTGTCGQSCTHAISSLSADRVCLKTLCTVQLPACSKLSTVTCVVRYKTVARWGTRTSVCLGARQKRGRLPCHGRRHGLIHCGRLHRDYCRDTLLCAFLCTVDTVQYLQITSTDSIITYSSLSLRQLSRKCIECYMRLALYKNLGLCNIFELNWVNHTPCALTVRITQKYRQQARRVNPGGSPPQENM